MNQKQRDTFVRLLGDGDLAHTDIILAVDVLRARVAELEAERDRWRMRAESELNQLQAERGQLRERLRVLCEAQEGDAWRVVGDGSDDPETMSEGMSVVMTGAQYRGLTDRAAKLEAEVERLHGLVRYKMVVTTLIPGTGQPRQHMHMGRGVYDPPLPETKEGGA